ncbi:MAG: peptidogalycan biosysnthesis protein [Hyphomicrobiaceae bacterium]
MPNEIEGFDYHANIERAGISGFEFGWYAAHERSRLLCVIPAFFTHYDLVTTAQGRARRALEAVRQFMPGGLSLGLACLGSPETERCQIGMNPAIDDATALAVFDELIGFWERDANKRQLSLLGIKDICGANTSRFGSVLRKRGYRAAASLPIAVLPITFQSVEEYFASLSAATRKDLRRKLRTQALVSVEVTRDIEAALPDIMVMYRETRERSDWAFEELSANYFRELTAGSNASAKFVLYRSSGTLVAANLLIEDECQIIDKFFVMRATAGRELNLYFLSWVQNVRRCLERGCHTFVAGAAGYETKLRLGCRLQRRSLYYRHRNAAANLMLRAVSPVLAVEQPATIDAACWESVI